MLDDGQFALSTFDVTIGGDHDQLGEPLEIRLINLNTPGTKEEPGIEVDFDNVRLFAKPVIASSVPMASQWGAIIMIVFMGAAALIAVRSRVSPRTSRASF